MATRRRFQVRLTHEDVLDYDITIERGLVRAFSLNYRAPIGDAWVEVVRYDTEHGHLHVHRPWRGRDRVETLENPQRPARAYNAALNEAEEDLYRNWERYRQRIEGAIR